METNEALSGPKPLTTVEARIDVGFGNTLFIRGQGDGLSWHKGQPLTCIADSWWVWSSGIVRGKVVFKLLLNDERWAQGNDLVVGAGETIDFVPVFP